MWSALGRLAADETGQDLVEYALLTTVVGLAGIAAFDFIRTAIGVAYGSWEVGVNSLWEPSDPVGAGS